jgi:hypothetical protein
MEDMEMTNNPSSKSVDEILGNIFGMWLATAKDGTQWLDATLWHIGDGIDDCSGTDGDEQLKSYLEFKSALYQLIKDRVIGENEYVINPVGELKVRQERGDMFHRNQFRNSQRKALQELFEVKDDKNGDLLK